MSAAIVALLVQIVWHVVRAVLEQTGIAAHSGYVASLAFGIAVATDLVIVAGVANAARRFVGLRRIGVLLAALAYVAIAANAVVYEGLVQRAGGVPGVQWWVGAMRDYGWFTLDALAVVGFALAAGRRAAWLAPIAVGAAVLGGRPALVRSPSLQIAAIVFVAIKVGLLVWMAVEAECHAATPVVARERGIRGLRRVELLAWVGAALAVLSAASLLAPFSMYLALPFGIVLMVVHLLLTSAAWSVAQARIPNMPRWLWYLSAICSGWAVARLVRGWFLTVTRWWGRFDEVPLHIAHWSTTIPGILASVSALVALALYARRTNSRSLALASLAAAGFVAVTLVLEIAVHEQVVLVSAGYFVFNIATARICGAARAVVDGEFPRARVL